MAFTPPPRQSPRQKTVLDDPKLKLSSDPLPNGEGRPSFHLYMAGNNPRIDVYTNLPNDKNRGNIRAPLDVRAMYTILECLKLLCDKPEETGPYILENKDHIWKDNQRSKEPVVLTRLVMGKDKEGRLYISLIAHDPERPKIRFYFGMPYYHQLTRSNGEKMTDAELSVWGCRNYIAALTGLYPAVAAVQYEHKPADKSGPNGGGGGGYNRQNNSAPAPRPAKTANTYEGGDDWGDDLPM